ncbi:hypothetical protein T484DRAFT_1908591 [Baffinella frigidus]|nr:hypothetical protein T484DRAFT_1908591 [Cryptophyta sp. CCMP2293]
MLRWEEDKEWHPQEREEEEEKFKNWLAGEEAEVEADQSFKAEVETDRVARLKLIQQGHPEDPDPLYGSLAFSKSEMTSLPLFDPARIAGYNNLEIWPRAPSVGVVVYGIKHLANRALKLHIYINEALSWTILMPPEHLTSSTRAAVVQLPHMEVGINYLAVTVALPDVEMAGGRVQEEVVLGVVGLVFILERWRYKDAWISELLDSSIVHTSNTTQVCANCRRTIHAAQQLCTRKEDQDAMAAADTKMPSFLANKLRLGERERERSLHWYQPGRNVSRPRVRVRPVLASVPEAGPSCPSSLRRARPGKGLQRAPTKGSSGTSGAGGSVPRHMYE